MAGGRHGCRGACPGGSAGPGMASRAARDALAAGEIRHVGGPQVAGVAAPASKAQAPRGKAEAPLSTHGRSCYTKTPNP